MIKENIAFVTWTNTECYDVWPMYFGRLEKHVNFSKSYVLLNEKTNLIGDRHIQLINNENDDFYKRFVSGLEQIEEDYVLYMQEDHIFYRDVISESINNLIEIIEKDGISNIRLLKSGEMGGQEKYKNIYKIPSNSQYLFSQQSSIWNRKDLIKLMNFYRPSTYRNVEKFGSFGMNNLNYKTYYYYEGEPQRGTLHCDSNIFPYIATAVCKRKWNLNQYPVLLKQALEEYNIDYKKRGIYEN